MAVKAGNLDELSELADKLSAAGLKDLVLDSGSRTVREALNDQIVIRRSALLKKFRPLGFPTITFPCEMTPTRCRKWSWLPFLSRNMAGSSSSPIWKAMASFRFF